MGPGFNTGLRVHLAQSQIPGLKRLFAYNFATRFGLSTAIMTYFGVNYDLSGLHSYAAGEPVPIQSWVYIAVAVVVPISSLAY